MSQNNIVQPNMQHKFISSLHKLNDTKLKGSN